MFSAARLGISLHGLGECPRSDFWLQISGVWRPCFRCVAVDTDLGESQDRVVAKLSSNKLCCPCCTILIHSLLNEIERLKVASSTSTREQILLTQGGPPLQSLPGQCLLAYQLLEEAGYPKRYKKCLVAIDETSGPRKHTRPSFLDCEPYHNARSSTSGGRFHLATPDPPYTIRNVASSDILVQSSSSGTTAVAYDSFARICSPPALQHRDDRFVRGEPGRAAHLRMPIVFGNRICGKVYKNAETK